MATHFSANQYENAFQPEKLGNWEIPQRYRKMPRKLEGYTEIIGTDKGYIKSDVFRSTKNPWGNFVGTWDLPTKIPGHSAGVITARTTSAQQRLQSDVKDANRVLSGKLKNEKRQASVKGSAVGNAGWPSNGAAAAAVDADLGPSGDVPAAGDQLPPELSGSPIVTGDRSPSPPTRPPNVLPAEPQDLN